MNGLRRPDGSGRFFSQNCAHWHPLEAARTHKTASDLGAASRNRTGGLRITSSSITTAHRFPSLHTGRWEAVCAVAGSGRSLRGLSP